MPYSYQESTHLSRENSLALKSLAATGELPKDHYWNALRTRHDANPTRFDKGNVVLAALLDRDLAQRQGTLSAGAPLFSNTGFFSYAGNKHTLNSTRFDHWHPFLGHLFEITLPPTNPAGQGLSGGGTTTPILPPGDLLPNGPTGPTGPTGPIGPTGPFLPPEGTGTSGGGGSPANPSIGVPEPASVLLMGMALTVVLIASWCRHRTRLRAALAPRLPVVA